MYYNVLLLDAPDRTVCDSGINTEMNMELCCKQLLSTVWSLMAYLRAHKNVLLIQPTWYNGPQRVRHEGVVNYLSFPH